MKKSFLCILLSVLICVTFGSAVCVEAVVSCGSANDGYVCHNATSAKYHTFGDRKMNYGVGDYGDHKRYYWMSGFNSTYQGYVREAVSDWMSSYLFGISTSIDISETSTQSKALFEFVNASLPTGVMGSTDFFLYDDPVSLTSAGALSSNYGWARCSINVAYMEQMSIYYAQKKATIAHELGHAMGLSHENCRASSVMCQYGRGRTTTYPDSHSFETINHLYG